VGNALDEARADQQLATSETQLENALTALARAQEALGVATGSDGALDAREDPDLGAAPATPEEALRQAETARADVRAARDRADAAHRVTRDSWADWLPTLAATGQTFVNRPSSTVSPYDGWQAQLVLSFPIFEGFLRVGQERERGALEAEARTQLEGLTLQARSDVRTALATLQHAQAALAQSRRGAERAHTALILVGGAYRAGATTSLDVVDAEQRARDADTAAVVAEDAVRQARLDLLAATGRFP
jgi:outer membrane protein TolC